jgi:hypothetical protein
MARTKILEFPFAEGQHEEIDARMLPDGYLTRAKNVRLRKDGRFGVRPDFDAIGATDVNSATIFHDDLFVSDDRLRAISTANGAGLPPETVYEYVAATTGNWHHLPENTYAPRIDIASNLRDLGRPPSQAGTSLFDIDAAATGGLVAMVFRADSTTYLHVFRASTEQTIYYGSISTTHTEVRVLAASSRFWLVASKTTSVDLIRFDPAVDAAPAAGNTVSSGGANITAVACGLDKAGTGFWVAVHRSATPATSIFPVTGAGVVGTATVGPATAFDSLAVGETVNRLMLLAVQTSDHIMRAYSYSGGALTSGPTAVFADATLFPPGLAIDGIRAHAYQQVLGTPNSVERRTVVDTTHALGSIGTTADANLRTHPFTMPNNSVSGNIVAFGGVHSESGGFISNVLVQPQQEHLLVLEDYLAAADASGFLGRVGYDTSTGKYYWPNWIVDGDARFVPKVTEFSYGSTGRRQVAALGGLLYLATGGVQVYDGQQLVDAGFREQPRIISATPSNGAGSLPSSVSLLVAVVWEWRDAKGNLHQSSPSLVTTVTMGVADDTITVVASAPHSLRKNASADASASSVTVVAYRSISGVSQLRRAESVQVATWGTAVTLTLLLDDTTVRAHGVIYTQAARGEFSGTVPAEGPLPAEYLWAFGARILSAGGPNRYLAQVSKELFPGEPVTWSGAAGFLLPALPEQIVGVAALDQRGLLFTSESIFQFAGDGPNDNGEGGYGEPVRLPASTGLRTWLSLLETPLGLFFQGGNGGIWIVPRDGSPPAWIGQPVRDTLDAFPVVTSATLLVDTQLASFTCNNALGTDARIVSYDLRAKTWIVDEFASATPIAAATHYQGRLVYASAGVAYRERTSSTPGAFIEHMLTTGDIKSAGGTGWFKFCRHDFIGEYRGDCNLRARLSYDGGKTFTAQTQVFQLRAASYAVGDLVRVSWDPPRRKCERVRIEYTAQTAGGATEGLVFNGFAVELMGASGGSRSAAAQRG